MSADSLVSRHIPALFGGISQQNPTLRKPSQAEKQINMYGTVMDGLRKRPPSQHVAQVTVDDWTSAFMHTINRDVSERYIVVVSSGDLKVFDANTGAEKTVNFPTGKGYLTVSGGFAADSFAIDTIADYSFVVNKTVTTAMKASETTQPTAYPDWYYPDVWGRDYRERPERFYNQYGSYGSGLTGTVNVFSDLPKSTDSSPPSNGDIYKVVGYDENNFGGYYVRRTGGVWEETYGPGANERMDETTLPHALIRESDGTFTFTPFAWPARQFGDKGTNPEPTFIGRTINGVFYWKNRLGFLTDENVVLSGSGDYGNFFRNTMTTLLDSDLVDVSVNDTKVSLLQYAIPFNNSMMLFADQTQYNLSARDLVTPTSVSIDKATGYEMDVGVKPVPIGSEVYFLSRTGRYSRVREYFVHPESLNTDAADVTAHVQQYVPRNVFKMAGNSVEDCLFLISDENFYSSERNKIYLYKFFWSGDEKIQSSWSHWEFDDGDRLLSIDAIEDELYLLIKRSDGTYLEKIDLDINSVVGSNTFDVLIDRLDVCDSAIYSAGPDYTEFTLKYPMTCANSKIRLVETSGPTPGRLLDPSQYTIVNSTTIRYPGNVSGNGVFSGVAYDATYELSEQFVHDGNGNADTAGRLQMRTMSITYQDAGYFRIKVWPYGTDFTEDVETVIPASLDDFTGRTLGEAQLTLGQAAFHTGSYRTYIDANAKDVVIQLINDSHLQCKFTSIEWEGLFTKRTRMI